MADDFNGDAGRQTATARAEPAAAGTPDRSAAHARSLRVFICSPGDVRVERQSAADVVRRLAERFRPVVRVEPYLWEDEPLQADDTFQAQIIDPADVEIVVCILWARLGSALPDEPRFRRRDETRYESGTQYEIERVLEARQNGLGPDLFVYRKNEVSYVSKTDTQKARAELDQKDRLDAFIERCFRHADGTQRRAILEFSDAGVFEENLEKHLRKRIEERLTADGVLVDGETYLPPATWKGSPFRGLRVFEFEHQPIFFGRTRPTAEALDVLRQNALAGHPFVLILGMSGSGKSSLARAGVVPRLVQSPRTIDGVDLWRRAIVRPGEGASPLDALAAALVTQTALPELLAGGTTIEDLTKRLAQSPDAADLLVDRALVEIAAAHQSRQNAGTPFVPRLVLVIDQLEELFTAPSATPDVRSLFDRVVAALARSGRIWVIATLRSDFYHRFAELPGLSELKDPGGQYDLAPPTATQLAQMVLEPARAAGLRFEKSDSESPNGPPLDEVLCQAAVSDPASLPLLEFTLEELYKEQGPQGLLTQASYRKLGGLAGALRTRAAAAYAALDQPAKDVLAPVFRQLVAIGPSEDAPTRKSAPLDQLLRNPACRAFVERFRADCLFTVERSPDGTATVQITHEALLAKAHWQPLEKWFERERELLRVKGRLAVAARLWDKSDRSNDLLLPSGQQLREVRQLMTAGFELSPVESEFFTLSARRARRNLQLKRGAIAGLTVLTAVSLTFAWIANDLRVKANHQEALASRAKKQTDVINKFLVEDLLAAARPEEMGKDVPMRTVVDKAAKKVETSFVDQPEQEAAVRLAIGETYRSLSLHAEAEKHLRRALAIRRERLGPDDPDTLKAVNSLAEVLDYAGKRSESAELFRQNLADRRRILGPDDPDTLQSLDNWAWSLARQDKLAEAEATNRDCLETRRRVLGPENRSTLLSVENLAQVLRNEGKLSEAEALYRKNLEDRRRVLPPDHPDILVSMNDLAQLLEGQARYDEAEKLFRETRELEIRVNGPSHRETLTVADNLANVLRERGKLPEAESLFRQALAARTRELGPDHPDTLESMSNLAGLLSDEPKLDEAEAIYRKLLETRRRVFGADNFDTLMTTRDLALLLSNRRQLAESERLFRTAVDGFKRSLGPEHEGTLRAIDGLAGVLEEEQKYDEAQTLRSEILAVRKRAEPNSPSTVNATFELGRLQADRGNLNAAEPLLRAAYEAERRLLKPEDAATLQSMDQLAFVLLDKGQLAQAEALYRDELAILRKNRPPADKDLAPPLSGLGRALSLQNKAKEAEPLLREALQIRKATLPADHWKVAFTESLLGECLSDQGQYSSAEPLLVGAYQKLKAARGPLPRQVAQAHDRVVKLYEAWKKPDAAARWKAEPLGK